MWERGRKKKKRKQKDAEYKNKQASYSPVLWWRMGEEPVTNLLAIREATMA